MNNAHRGFGVATWVDLHNTRNTVGIDTQGMPAEGHKWWGPHEDIMSNSTISEG